MSRFDAPLRDFRATFATIPAPRESDSFADNQVPVTDETRADLDEIERIRKQLLARHGRTELLSNKDAA